MSALAKAATKDEPRIALALGAGGARGLAHVFVLEAFDELGLRPAIVAGTSMGAIFGAAYCAGLPGRDLRAHAAAVLRTRGEVFGKLLPARTGRFVDLLGRGLGNPVLLDAEKLLGGFLPPGLPEDFAGLDLPFLTVATDYYRRAEYVIEDGALRSAVAASMAIPGLISPVVRDGRVLVDGGAVNPLPFDLLCDRADIIVACDVTGGPSEGGAAAVPGPADCLFSTLQIMMNAIVDEKLKSVRPDVLVRPNVSLFRALDFLKATAILKAAEPVKDEVKRGLETAFETWRLRNRVL